MTKYLVSYDKAIDVEVLRTTLTNSGCTILEILSSLGVLILESQDTTFSSVDGILAYEVESTITIDAHWHLNRICSFTLPMRPTYIAKNKGEGVTVYLMDSGIDNTHPELSDADIQHFWSWDNTFTDTNGHGTGLASVIVGSTLGVSPKATVKSVKIPLGQTVSTSILLNAFDAILQDHLLTSGIKVINCSWSIPKSLILDTKIIELQEKGLVVVAAAGNNMIDANTLSPVGLNTVLGVAASDVFDRVISWAPGAGSNWGPDVDITAPGIDVTVAGLDGSIYETSGTSVAAAVVTGAVCQYIKDNPSVTSAHILQDIVVANARMDMLFRNESIYGTTPNRLISIPATQLITSPVGQDAIIPIQKGTVSTVPVILEAPATTIQIHNLVVGSYKRTAPEWISLDNSTLTISPPATIDTSRYVLEMNILDENNNRVGYSQLLLKIYDTSPAELDDTELYAYFNVSENGTVTILQSFCGGACTGPQGEFLQFCENLGKNCTCEFNVNGNCVGS